MKLLKYIIFLPLIIISFSFSQPPTWLENITDAQGQYPDAATYTSIVLDTKGLVFTSNAESLFAAFDGDGNIRGAIYSLANPLIGNEGTDLFFLQVWGPAQAPFTSNELIFKFYDANTEIIYGISETSNFISNSSNGSPVIPIVWNVVPPNPSFNFVISGNYDIQFNGISTRHTSDSLTFKVSVTDENQWITPTQTIVVLEYDTGIYCVMIENLNLPMSVGVEVTSGYTEEVYSATIQNLEYIIVDAPSFDGVQAYSNQNILVSIIYQECQLVYPQSSYLWLKQAI